MVNGNFATEFNPWPGSMWGAAVNHERAAISQHLGIGTNREICRSASPEIWPEAVGAPSPGPGQPIPKRLGSRRQSAPPRHPPPPGNDGGAGALDPGAGGIRPSKI